MLLLAVGLALALQNTGQGSDIRAFTDEVLRAVEEKALSESGPTLRLVVLPSFSDLRILRFESQGARLVMTTRRVCPLIEPAPGVDIDAPEGLPPPKRPPRCEPGETLGEDVRALTGAEAREFQVLAEKGFWQAEEKDGNAGFDLSAGLPVTLFDGTAWIVEGVRRGETRVIVRWSPPAGAFCAFASKALALAAVTDPTCP